MTDFEILLHGDVWDAKNGERSDHWVGIRDGEIATVSPEKPGAAPITKEVTTIIPGLCDMHVHLVWDGSGDPVATLRQESTQETTLRAATNARQQLRGGVTTVRDVGSVDDIAIPVARAIRNGWIDGPRTHASGRTIIISGGHDPFWGLESDGPNACRQAVRKLRNAGADLIKVSATGGVYGQAVGEDPGVSELTCEELSAIVDEAHRFDLDVAAHAVGREGIQNAIEAGVDTIEHGNEMDEALLSELQRAGGAYDPTLYVYARIAEGSDGIPEYARRNAERVYRQHAEAFREALEMDIRLLAGSDAGSPQVPHPGLHLELQQLVSEGMAETDALEAATLAPATELGQEELGVLEPDTVADVVCFADDPRTTIASVEEPIFVVNGGKPVS